MSRMFFDGQELQAIFWPNDEETIRAGINTNITSIEVVMESGQMAGVPWAIVSMRDGRQYKYNLALAKGVEI